MGGEPEIGSEGRYPAATVGASEAMQPEGRLDLTIVVPYYNPGPNLAGHVAQVIEVLREREVSFEVIAVSDGSTDGNDVGLAELGPEVQVIHLPINQGKGRALRVGFGLGRGSYLGFIDGDGDIPAPVLGEFVSCIQKDRPDFAIGSKRHPESVVVYPRLRRFYSWGYQVLTRLLFGLDLTDTQSGIKLARREIVTELLPILEEDGFTFDLELLAVARRLGYTASSSCPSRSGSASRRRSRPGRPSACSSTPCASRGACGWRTTTNGLCEPGGSPSGSGDPPCPWRTCPPSPRPRRQARAFPRPSRHRLSGPRRQRAR